MNRRSLAVATLAAITLAVVLSRPAPDPSRGATRSRPDVVRAAPRPAPTTDIRSLAVSVPSPRATFFASADLDAKTLKKIAKLEKKLGKQQAKEAKVESKLDAILDSLQDAVDALDAAHDLEAETPQEQKAKAKAIKKAEKALAKWIKKQLKAQAKLGKILLKQVDLVDAIEELDPDHFSSSASAPLLIGDGGVGQVTFSWDEVPGVDAHTLYVATSSGVDTQNGMPLPGVTSPHVVDELAPGVTLHAILVTSHDGGDVTVSDEVAASTLALPAAPAGLVATPDVGEITLAWAPVDGASGYSVAHSPGAPFDAEAATLVDDVSSPWTHDGLADDATVSYVVVAHNAAGLGDASAPVTASAVASASPYDPAWAAATPLLVVSHAYDPGASPSANGAALKAAILALQPGERLEIDGGVYSIDSYFNVSLQGTALHPIRIAAADGEVPVLTRPDANQNVVNVGSTGQGPARFVSFEGLEITGGSSGMRLHDCEDVWVDRCHVHHVGDAGLTTNTEDTARLHITRNHIHDTSGFGEGMYLGANHGAVIMSESIIALNHVHDTGGTQGDGIELKQGSWGNWIVGNSIHDTQYPCLLVYGTDGEDVNVIERNVLVGSDDNVLQVQGEAIVRNNLVVDGAVGLHSHDHQGTTRDLVVVHNTIVNGGRATNLSSWDNRPGMVFANNAVYSQSGQSLHFPNGSLGVTLAGNVVVGATTHASSSGYVVGAGLSDFVGLAWDGSALDATPSEGGALVGAGDAGHAVDEDLDGNPRAAPFDAGCVERQP